MKQSTVRFATGSRAQFDTTWAWPTPLTLSMVCAVVACFVAAQEGWDHLQHSTLVPFLGADRPVEGFLRILHQ